MIRIFVYKDKPSYTLSTKKVKEAISETLKDQGIKGDAEVSVAIISRQKMRELVDKYYEEEGQNEDHPVLAFPSSEVKGEFIYPPKTKNFLGEIVLSYDKVLSQSEKSGQAKDEVAMAWASHATLHLLGIHHDH